MTAKKMNLHQKLVELRKMVPYIQKDAEGYGFQYAKGSVLLGMLRPTMDELGILLYHGIDEVQTEDVQRIVKGKTVLTARAKLKYVFTFVDADNPSDKIEIVKWTQGIGDDIQSMGGYDTYMLRYFLLGFLSIPSDKDDPDTHENSLNAAKPKEVDDNLNAKFKKTITKAQLDTISNLINGHDDIRSRMMGTYKDLSDIPYEKYQIVINTIQKLIEDKGKK